MVQEKVRRLIAIGCLSSKVHLMACSPFYTLQRLTISGYMDMRCHATKLLQDQLLVMTNLILYNVQASDRCSNGNKTL